jgi:hypothetical protein
MPGFDGTGPQGAGPMTGHGVGFCRRDYPTRRYRPLRNAGCIYGVGYRARGHAWRKRFYPQGIPRSTTPTSQLDIADLNALADQLKTQLDAIQKRIDKINS